MARKRKADTDLGDGKLDENGVLSIRTITNRLNSLPPLRALAADDTEDGEVPARDVQDAQRYIQVFKLFARRGIPVDLSDTLRERIESFLPRLDEICGISWSEELWHEDCGLFRGGGVVTSDPLLQNTFSQLQARKAKFNCLSDLLAIGTYIQGAVNFAADTTSSAKYKGDLLEALDKLLKFQFRHPGAGTLFDPAVTVPDPWKHQIDAATPAPSLPAAYAASQAGFPVAGSPLPPLAVLPPGVHNHIHLFGDIRNAHQYVGHMQALCAVPGAALRYLLVGVNAAGAVRYL